MELAVIRKNRQDIDKGDVMKRGQLMQIFALALVTTASGYGCATTNSNDDHQYRQVKGQTGQVVRDVGGRAGRGVGEKAAEAFGSAVTEEECRLLRVEHQERIAEMQRDSKISPDDVGQARVTHQRLESSCDQQAQSARKKKDFFGNISEQLGRIGGEILNQKGGMKY